MLTISKPLSAGQAKRYHAEEFQNARENYYTAGDQIRGQWHGQLAETWGLHGEVQPEHFERAAEGQHPRTGEVLVRHQTPRTSTNARGEAVTTMEHRAGWDATFSAPKSVSLTALVGGDERVRQAHRESVAAALHELEQYAQARMGGNRQPETTGKLIAASFEHDSARPVNGYAAPQLHTHVVVFNLTETENGEVRPLQPRELYKTQQYATAVYRSELASRLHELGYEIERGKSGQPEIRGYTQAYLDASSPRRQQIERHLASVEHHGASAAQIAAHQTRERKLDLPPAEMQRRHQEMADAFGQQPASVVQHARTREPLMEQVSPAIAGTALTFAKERNLERDAVVEERDILRDALTRSMGHARLDEIKSEFERRIEAGEFLPADSRTRAPGRAFTTPDMIAAEQDTIAMMHTGQQRASELASSGTRHDIEQEYRHLSQSQHAAVQHILASRDQMVGLEGVAGAGKTTALSAVRDAAERDGYAVQGFAPTSRAAEKLSEAGIESRTLQWHLARSEAPRRDEKRLYVVDESSLVSTKQMHAFLGNLRESDRVLLVGDVRQHQAVEAGRISNSRARVSTSRESTTSFARKTRRFAMWWSAYPEAT